MLWGIELLRFFSFNLMFYVSVLLSRRSMTQVQRQRTCGCRDQQSPSTTLTPSPKSRPSARAMEGQINLGMELGSLILTLPLVGHWLLVHYQVKYEDLNLCCTCIIACPVWWGFVLFFLFYSVIHHKLWLFAIFLICTSWLYFVHSNWYRIVIWYKQNRP